MDVFRAPLRFCDELKPPIDTLVDSVRIRQHLVGPCRGLILAVRGLIALRRLPQIPFLVTEAAGPAAMPPLIPTIRPNDRLSLS
jgi:hypothetical protein